MADNVRYILDKMAPVFKQLEELELFSNVEVKSIIKRRTDYEYVLKRRQLEPTDYTSYLQYEVNLDKLQNSRVKRLQLANSKEKIHALRSVQAAFIRHISYIFERALRRFPNEMSLWTDYISYLKLKQSNSILNTVFGRALALHPKHEDFWLQAAMHELEVNSNSHAARVMLQRAIRVNKSSRLIWLKYFELELWNAVRVVERQKGLGLETTPEVVEEGAPLVVFRHAMDALGGTAASSSGSGSASDSAIEDLLAMHLSCEGVAPALGDALAEDLKARYGLNPRLWRHLAELQVNRELYRGSDLNTTAKGTRKRMRHMQRASIESAVSAATGAITACLELLTEAGVAHGEFTDDNDEPLPLSGDLVGIALGSISATLQKSAQVVVCAVQSAATSSSATGGKSSKAPAAKRSRKNSATSEVEADEAAQADALEEAGDGSGEDDDDDEEEEEDTVTPEDALHAAPVGVNAATENALALLKTPLLAVAAQLQDYAAAIGATADPVAKAALEARYHAACHHTWLFLAGVCGASVEESGSAASLVDSASFLAWVESSAPGVYKAALRVPGVDRRDTTALIDAWCSAASVLLRTLLTAARADAHGEALLGLCAALAPVAPMLASHSSRAGNQLLLDAVHAAVRLGQSAAAQAVFQSAIAGPTVNSAVNAKGAWCVRYLQFMAAEGTSDGAGGSAGDSCALRRALRWVLDTAQSRPHLFAGAEMEPLLEFAVNHELARGGIRIGEFGCDEDEEVAAQTESEDETATEQRTGVLQTVKGIVERATVMCPADGRFWDLLADVERMLGNQQAANHTAWKKSRALL